MALHPNRYSEIIFITACISSTSSVRIHAPDGLPAGAPHQVRQARQSDFRRPASMGFLRLVAISRLHRGLSKARRGIPTPEEGQASGQRGPPRLLEMPEAGRDRSTHHVVI